MIKGRGRLVFTIPSTEYGQSDKPARINPSTGTPREEGVSLYTLMTGLKDNRMNTPPSSSGR